MVDTARTKADLQANLFQDGQVDGAITEQDMRDLIESMHLPMGTITIATPAATTIAVQGTFVKAAGTTVLAPTAHKTTMPANNRLQIDSGFDIGGTIIITASFTCASNNQIISFKAAVNGVVVDESEVNSKIGTGADVQAVPLSGTVSISDGDQVELWVTNKSGTASPTVETMTLNFQGAFK